MLASDLGLDRIYVYRFDDAKGTLAPNDPPAVELPPGDGPRHFAFHRNGRWFYSLQEEASTLATYDFDSATGRLTLKQTISTLPKGFAGTNFTSEVMVSPDAPFVYAANRLHDSIAWFRIGSDGTLTLPVRPGRAATIPAASTSTRRAGSSIPATSAAMQWPLSASIGIPAS